MALSSVYQRKCGTALNSSISCFSHLYQDDDRHVCDLYPIVCRREIDRQKGAALPALCLGFFSLGQIN